MTIPFWAFLLPALRQWVCQWGLSLLAHEPARPRRGLGHHPFGDSRYPARFTRAIAASCIRRCPNPCRCFSEAVAPDNEADYVSTDEIAGFRYNPVLRPSGGTADAAVSKTAIHWMCEFESHLGHQSFQALQEIAGLFFCLVRALFPRVFSRTLTQVCAY